MEIEKYFCGKLHMGSPCNFDKLGIPAPFFAEISKIFSA
jgi:hypothetical protein